MRVRWLVLVVWLGTLGLGGCGGDQATNGGGEPVGASATPEPTKAELVQTLRDLLATLEASDWDHAVTFLVPLPNMKPEDIPEALASFLERNEISAEGIDLLEKEGAFGELDDLCPERGKSWAGRLKVDPDRCWALVLDDAEVAAFWDGQAFQLIRLDDVGKLK